ncbi:MAG: glycosyltransferase, partial [Deltaproteobacteria bacterium]|nr:glycosyltransferase [Deltaproteobacteria bacterium]
MIPCLNEEHTVADVVQAVPREVESISSVRVLVLDDGSTDETAARARAAGAEVVSHRENRGLGKTFREGAERALAMGADII